MHRDHCGAGFLSKGHWQSAVSVLWNSTFGLGLIIFFRHFFNHEARLSHWKRAVQHSLEAEGRHFTEASQEAHLIFHMDHNVAALSFTSIVLHPLEECTSLTMWAIAQCRYHLWAWGS
jgi:hypothetical protein